MLPGSVGCLRLDMMFVVCLLCFFFAKKKLRGGCLFAKNKKKRERWLEYNIADQLHFALVHVRLHNDSEVTSPI